MNLPPSPWPETTAFRPDHVAHRGADSPIQTAKAGPLFPRQARFFFFSALGFSGAPFSLREQRLAPFGTRNGALLHQSESGVFFPTQSVPTYLTWPAHGPTTTTSTPCSPRNHPKRGRTRTETARKSTTKKRMGPKAGTGDQIQSS